MPPKNKKIKMATPLPNSIILLQKFLLYVSLFWPKLLSPCSSATLFTNSGQAFFKSQAQPMAAKKSITTVAGLKTSAGPNSEAE